MVKEFAHPIVEQASTISYHMVKACNMSCGFCFATFLDFIGNKLKWKDFAVLVERKSATNFMC